MRLIDADILKECLRMEFSDANNALANEYNNGIDACIDTVDTVHTIDAVPVIRCCECKYNNIERCKKHDFRFPAFDWFCADGERRC